MQHACAYPPEGVSRATRTALVLGIGNCLMSDDGVGVHALNHLMRQEQGPSVHYVDGGTVGLALAPLIEDAEALVVLDAVRLGAPPGSVHLYEGRELDRLVLRRHGTPHEVSLADLLGVARLQGRLPERRALVGVEPLRVTVGFELSPCVAAAVVQVAVATRTLLARWAVEPCVPAMTMAVNPSP
jgi:hydrogenase maturation protease